MPTFPEIVMYGLLAVVTLVWLLNFIFSVLLSGYMSNPEIHLAFMGAIGLISTIKGLAKKPENSK